MSHFRISDDITDHPQFYPLSDRAFRVWIYALAYCQRHLTDGVLPGAVVRQLPRADKRSLDALLTAGLLRCRADDTFELVGYLKHNDSRSKVEQARARWRVKHAGAPASVPPGTLPDLISDLKEKEDEHARVRERIYTWRLECDQLHGGTCGNRRAHDLVLARRTGS